MPAMAMFEKKEKAEESQPEEDPVEEIQARACEHRHFLILNADFAFALLAPEEEAEKSQRQIIERPEIGFWLAHGICIH